MKIVAVLLLAASLLLSACGSSKPKPDPSAAAWGNAKWDSATWER